MCIYDKDIEWYIAHALFTYRYQKCLLSLRSDHKITLRKFCLFAYLTNVHGALS